MSGPWEKYGGSQTSGPWQKYGAAANAPEEVPPHEAPEPSTLSKVGSGLEDLGKGLGESAVGMMSTGDEWARQHLPAFFTNKNLGFGAPADLQHVHDIATPADTMQAVGKGLGNAAQFMIPGGAEEAAAGMLPRVFQPLGRVAASALSSGAINKAQGGGFGMGAALGAAGGAAGEGLRAAAPRIMEWAQGVNTPGAKTGKALLEETRSIFPSGVRNKARALLDELNPEMESLVDRASVRPSTAPIGPQLEPNPSVSLLPARQVAQEGVEKAAGGGSALAPFGRNEPKMAKGVKRLGRIVNEDLEGNPLPENVTPRQALELRRGVDSALPKGSFNPKSENMFKGYRTPLRNVLNRSIEEQAPGYQALASRESALIPASKPPMHTFGHVWGPGAGAMIGGFYGARPGIREGNPLDALGGGLAGAAEGGTAGFAAPAIANIVARAGASRLLPRVFLPMSEGAALQMNHPQDLKRKR